MAKLSKKAPTFQYGIQISKPHSTAMYNHNDEVALLLKTNIMSEWNKALNKAQGEWESDLEEDQKGLSFLHDSDFNSFEDSLLVNLSKSISFTGYGSGFTMGDVNDDFKNDLENMPNWQLHQCYGEMKHAGLVPLITEYISYGAPQGAMMVGFDNEYSYCAIYNTYDCYEDQLTDEYEKAANPNYSNPKYTGIEVPCSRDLDIEMANESENIQ